jgi:hypothetical protein
MSVSAASTFFGCFEFDENNLTQYSNSAPCLHITGYGSTSTLGNYIANDIGDHNVVSLLATYNPVTSTTPAVRALTSTSTMHMSNIATFGLASATSTEYLTRRFALNNRFEIATAPLFIDDSNISGIINCSKHSNIYLHINHCQELTTLTSALDGSQYKVWRLYNSNNSSFSTILVKYA